MTRLDAHNEIRLVSGESGAMPFFTGNLFMTFRKSPTFCLRLSGCLLCSSIFPAGQNDLSPGLHGAHTFTMRQFGHTRTHWRPSLAPTAFSHPFTLFSQSLAQRLRDAGTVTSPNTASLSAATAGHSVVNARSCESAKAGVSGKRSGITCC